jgi:hypothetical protein
VGDLVPGCHLVHGREFVPGGGDADFQPGDLPASALLAGLGEAGAQAGQDVGQPLPLGGVRAQGRAADAGVLVDARSAEVAGAHAQLDLAELEVAQELVPLGRAEVSVFFAGAQGAAAGDERPVAGDDVLGVDRSIPMVVFRSM